MLPLRIFLTAATQSRREIGHGGRSLELTIRSTWSPPSRPTRRKEERNGIGVAEEEAISALASGPGCRKWSYPLGRRVGLICDYLAPHVGIWTSLRRMFSALGFRVAVLKAEDFVKVGVLGPLSSPWSKFMYATAGGFIYGPGNAKIIQFFHFPNLDRSISKFLFKLTMARNHIASPNSGKRPPTISVYFH